MVEFAIVLPLLVVIFLAVGYFGHLVISLQSLNAAARSAARELGLQSTATVERRMSGFTPTAEMYLAEAKRYGAGIKDRNLRVGAQTRFNHNYKELLGLEGDFSTLSPQRHVYVLRESVNAAGRLTPAPSDLNGKTPANLENLRFGLGAVFYGGSLEYRIPELEPISRFLFRDNPDDPAVRMRATVLMPAEAPLKGAGYGLLEINPWISQILGENPETSSNYSDLIP